jgi:hypothetical protein
MKKMWDNLKAIIFSEYAPLLLIYIIAEVNLIVSLVLSYKEVGSFKGLFENLSTVGMPNLFNNIYVKLFVGLILIYIAIIIIRYFFKKNKDYKFCIFLVITLALTVFAGVCTFTAMFYDQNNLGQLVYRVLYFNFMKDGQSNVKFALYVLYLIIPGLCVLYSLVRIGKENKEEYLRYLLYTMLFNSFGLMVIYFIIATLFAYVWALLLAGICIPVAYVLGMIAVQDAMELGENKKIQHETTRKKRITKKADKKDE